MWLTCAGWPLRQPRGHRVPLQRRLLRRQEPGVCQRRGHQGLGHQRAARVAELQRVLVGHWHRHGHGKVRSGHCGLNREQGVKGEPEPSSCSTAQLLTKGAQSGLLKHPLLTSAVLEPTLAPWGDAPEPSSPQGNTGKSNGLSPWTHQSSANNSFGLIFRLNLFTPCIFRAVMKERLGAVRSMKVGTSLVISPPLTVAKLGTTLHPKQPARIS